MKKKIFAIFIALASVFAFTFVSCNDEKNVWDCNPEKGVEIKLTFQENNIISVGRIPNEGNAKGNQYLSQLKLQGDNLYRI